MHHVVNRLKNIKAIARKAAWSTMKPLSSVLVAAFFIGSTQLNCLGDMVLLQAIADGDILADGTVDDIDDTISTQTAGNQQRRGIFEFDFSVIPNGAIIELIEFSGYTNLIASLGNDAVVDLQGYVGSLPGQVTTSDYSALGSSVGTLFQANGDLLTGEVFSIELTDLFNAQLAADANTVFGIRSSITNTHTWTIRSVDHPDGPRPTLTINFSAVPEPNSCCLFGLSAIGFGFFRRR